MQINNWAPALTSTGSKRTEMIVYDIYCIYTVYIYTQYILAQVKGVVQVLLSKFNATQLFEFDQK